MIDVEKMLRSGMSLDDINKVICNEMNAAQKKLDAEKKAKEEAFRKEEAARKAKEEKEKNEKRYFNAAVAALGTYLTVVSKYEFTKEEVELAVRSAAEGLMISKKFMAAIDEKGEMKNPNDENMWDTIMHVFGVK